MISEDGQPIFVDKEIMPVRHMIDDDVTHENIVEPILKKLQVDLGWQKAMIPKHYGGNEAMSLVSGALKQEQLSRGDYGISLASACVDWTLAPATMAFLFAPRQLSLHGEKPCLMSSLPDSLRISSESVAST